MSTTEITDAPWPDVIPTQGRKALTLTALGVGIVGSVPPVSSRYTSASRIHGIHRPLVIHLVRRRSAPRSHSSGKK